MLIRSAIALGFLFTLLSCAKSGEESPPPLVTGVKQSQVFMGLTPTASPAVSAEITLNKAALLGRSFLYGTSLQSSSLNDGESEEPTSLLAIVVAQTPAEFRVVGDRLRLLSDSRLGFESDINHPSSLLQEFRILRQDQDTLTIRAERASPTLHGVVRGEKKETSERLSFLRSFEYVEGDELFLIESTIEMSDGSLAEFMETLTPRERMVPADAKPFYVDKELNPVSDRFRFITGDGIYVRREDGRAKTTVAERFHLRDGAPIRWYVTRNVPEQYLVDVRNGVEAWNRYAAGLGLAKLVEFAGLLPEGVKIGDPRYNIIVWDNVEQAGAAYESQASDPSTGAQTHSLVYLPAAWMKIGKAYWENAAVTDESNERRLGEIGRLLKSRSFLGRRLPVHCLDGAHRHLTPASRETPEEFARGLLKGVIFHELGHALGLAHNFKGSLSYSPDRAGSLFTSSVMDYNLYNEEAGAFESADSANGPIFEYDRQILSVLYKGADSLSGSDPVLPACADEEAESSVGGVDPLCVPYDLGEDPTRQAGLALAALEKTDTRNGRMSSLPVALARAASELPAAAGVLKLDDAKKAVADLLKVVKGSSGLYVGSVSNLGSSALRSLHVVREGSLPEGYDESAMRERALQLLESAVRMESFPAGTHEALRRVRETSLGWLQSTPALQQLPEQERGATLGDLTKSIDASLSSLEQPLLSKLRTNILSALKHNAEAPLSFHARNGVMVDLEAFAISELERLAAPAAGGERPAAERLAAIKTLATYAKIPAAKEAGARLKESLNVEIRGAGDARKREGLRKLLEALSW